MKANAMTIWVFRLCRWSALLGGAILCLMTLMIVASITGRSLMGLGLGPIPGDVELVEAGTAIAVFMLLPWAYLKDGHASVDVVYLHMPRVAQRAVQLISDALMLLVWLALTWMLFEGMLEKRSYEETTFILQMPVWWAYALCGVGAAVGCLAYLTKPLIVLGLADWPTGWPTETTKEH